MACCMLSNFQETSRAHWSQGDDLRSANQMNQGIQKMNGFLNDHLLFKNGFLEVDPNINDLDPPHQHPKTSTKSNHDPSNQLQPRSQLGIHRDHEKIDDSNQASSDKPKVCWCSGRVFLPVHCFGLPSSDVLKMCWPCNTAGAIFLLGPYWILLTNLQRESTHQFYTFHHFLEDGAHSLKHTFSFCVTYEAKLITTFNRKTTWHHHSRHADLCAGPLNTFTIFATQPCNVTAQMM